MLLHEYKVFTTRTDDGSRVGMPLIAIVLVTLFSYFANKNIKHGESNVAYSLESASNQEMSIHRDYPPPSRSPLIFIRIKVERLM